MSWLRKQGSFRLRRPAAILKNADPKTLLEAFREHCSQANALIQKWDLTINFAVRQDDVAAILNHLEQMVNYILEESAAKSFTGPPSTASTLSSMSSTPSPVPSLNSYAISPILDYILDNDVLEKILEWSLQTSEFTLRLLEEQLRIYEILTSNCSQRLLYQKGFLSPLQKLLSICQTECPEELERRLVALLNTLCVTLSQNSDLLQIFFNQKDDPPDFVVFSLLIPFVHREGCLGHQARDAILLCMCLAAKNHARMDELGRYMANHSTFCPVLATGLSGLYSVLPRKLGAQSEDWFRLTDEDIHEIPELASFLNSLEFCNAVTQVSHPLVRDQLLDYLLHGFLIPVMAPALYQSNTDEIVTTTVYLELFLRKVTEPRLVRVFLHFLMTTTCERRLLIDILMLRIGAHSKLSLVTISFFKTLVDFNCEEVMYELVFKYLLPCSHIMLAHRDRIRDVDTFCVTSQRLLSLTTSNQPGAGVKQSQSFNENLSSQISPNDQIQYLAYILDAKNGVRACRDACQVWSRSYDGSRNESQRKDNPVNNLHPNGNGDLKLLTEEREDSGIFVNDQRDFSADIGPFLTQILVRLEMLPINDVYTNLQLTSLVARLALYPQPLLRSFLLSQEIVFQPSIRSLYQILCTLRHKLDHMILQLGNSSALMQQAREFFAAREQHITQPSSLKSSVSKDKQVTVERPVPAQTQRRRSLGIFFRKFGVLQPIADNGGYRYIAKPPPERDVSSESSQNSAVHRNQMTAVLSMIVFDEFVKELAAISQEQALQQLLDEVPAE
ncbi:UPF0518 protein GF15501 [Galendromus occidentalis]|uniref:UPF0518 protein GF15501 n=1 Tax=Galendromus occidentalis TaxID=34638 RepID=A0AAJ6QSZ7_9ACAR|nr:UPF0518 protein GF15501 [Galendromus occidentalis]